MNNGETYLGKYRGSVIDNIDPLQTGRLLVTAPDVPSMNPVGWAMPCLPLAGNQMGTYMIPPVGANVWIEFEQGDPAYPIWVGCWWGTMAETPPLALAGPTASPNIVLQSTGQNALVISDAPGPDGGIMLKSSNGAMLLVNDLGITIANGRGAIITLIGPTVTVNQGALAIT